MERKEGRRLVTLPDELVARILGMVPFPFMFKARALSKSWRAKFSPIASQVNEVEKFQATLFQAEVCERSLTKWSSFCPIFVRNEDMVGYDRSSRQWTRLPSPSFLPARLFIRAEWSRLQGTLLLVSTDPFFTFKIGILSQRIVYKANTETGLCPGYNFYVVNILTRSWRQLPPRPLEHGRTHTGEKWLIRTSLASYKVVVLHEDKFKRYLCFAEIYDSKTDAWSGHTKLYEAGDIGCEGLSNWAHLNGALYRMVGIHPIGMGLLAFNVMKGSFKGVQLHNIRFSTWSFEMAVCHGSLIILMYDRHEDGDFTSVTRVTLRRTDFRSRRCVEIARGPPAALKFGKFRKHPASDGDSLFFVGAADDSGILAYNVKEDKWSRLPFPPNVLDNDHNPGMFGKNPYNAPTMRQYRWDSSCFRPGLNPFVEV